MSDYATRLRFRGAIGSLRVALQVAVFASLRLIAICNPLPGATTQDPVTPGELELKAGFVLNFIRLVNWTNISGEPDNRELPVCACLKSDYFSAVRDISVGKTVGTRSIVFR